MQVMRYSRTLVWAVAAILASSCAAQVMQAPGTMPDGRRVPPLPGIGPRQGISKPPAAITQPAAQPGTGKPGIGGQPGNPAGTPGGPAGQPAGAVASAAQSALLPASNLAPSLGDKPAGPAHVTLNGGSLAVNANNSSLSQILKDLEATSGMTVDGFDKDSRVFGVYGPGPPRDVLSELLDGAGYNFLMVGETNAGTPREVVLTARSNAPITTGQASAQHEEEEEEPPPPPPPVEEVTPKTPTPNPADQRPRTPQEMLQELQRIRQQQQQPQGGQAPQPQ